MTTRLVWADALTRRVSAGGPLVLAVALLCLVTRTQPAPAGQAVIGLAVLAGALLYLTAPVLAAAARPFAIVIAIQHADRAVCWHWTAPHPTGAPYGPVSGQEGR